MIGELKIHPPELAALKAAIVGKKRFLEIGTFHGVTAALLAESNPDCLIVSLDIFRDVSSENWFANRRKNQLLFVGTAQALCNLGVAELFDVIFVDANHKYDPCLADLVSASAMLALGGSILAHDYDDRFPGVVLAVDTFCEQQGWRIVAKAGMIVELRNG